jgi:transcriptional antiterminator RfaH
MSEAWYALKSKPQKEMTVWHQAESRGFEIFFPCVRIEPVNPRSRRIRPYFPGYMFVRADLKQVGVSTFQFMPYTMGLVSFGSEPAVVADAIIQDLRCHMERIQREKQQPAHPFRKGDTVRIKDGPFEGYLAIFDHTLSGDDRVLVLLEMLADRRLHLQISASELEKVRTTTNSTHRH